MKNSKCCCLITGLALIMLYMKYESEIYNFMKKMTYKINM